MEKVNLAKMIKRFPVEEQASIHAKSAKITEARAQARKQQDKIAKEGAEKLRGL
jgi:hypothetical protein